MGNYVAGIDFGTTKIVMLVGEKSAGGIKIVGYSEVPSTGVKRGEVVNIQKVMDSLKPCIEDINKQIEDLGYKLSEVYAGISGLNIRSKTDTLKRLRPKPEEWIMENEVAGMIEEMYNSKVEQNEKVLYVIPQSYNIDEHINVPPKDVVGMEGKEVEGYFRIIVGRINTARFIESVINKLGLRVKKMILNPIASGEAVLTEDEKELGAAVVDIGSGTTDVMIIQDYIVRHIAIIPFGGNSISEDIRQECEVSFHDAETLKIGHGSCLSEFASDKYISIPNKGIEVPYKKLYKIIEARVSEILATVAYEIEQSGYKDKLLAGIIITGGSSSLKHIEKLANVITGMKVRIAIPEKPILMSTSVESIFNPASATAAGLVIKGFEYEEIGKTVEPEVKDDVNRDLFGNPIEEASAKNPKKKKKSFRETLKNFTKTAKNDLFSDDNDA